MRSIAEHTMLPVRLAGSGDEAVAALAKEHGAHRKALLGSVRKAEGWQAASARTRRRPGRLTVPLSGAARQRIRRRRTGARADDVIQSAAG
ncbi:hypothetical protein ACFC1R_28435 [Kitasatospora sp. NPDC056138]|uniref:hypothetical protein n=1 Tax=Kitasatospora sp. NPDC056138 TaxID=3345724 RepID=UPI0035D5CDEB